MQRDPRPTPPLTLHHDPPHLIRQLARRTHHHRQPPRALCLLLHDARDIQAPFSSPALSRTPPQQLHAQRLRIARHQALHDSRQLLLAIAPREDQPARPELVG